MSARIVSSTITRPNDTTAYASGDLVANSTTAGSVTPFSFTVDRGAIRRVIVRKSSVSVTNTSFRVHFYRNITITCANGDNGAWSTDQVANYLGFIDVTQDKAFTDGAFGIAAFTHELHHALGMGDTLKALLEARAAYTPTAQETITLELECVAL
jgi:hypothetical protein